ncbi:MAG: Uma2 family endonuclease [Vulcanimicrobiota bacterium]
MALSNYAPRYTVEDHALWEGEWELWSGSPVAMSPSPGMVHQILAGRLIQRMNRALEEAKCCNCRAILDIDWRVNQNTVLRPDLLVVYDHPLAVFVSRTPKLVAEILSDSTRQRDLLYKRDMYEQLGVEVYLIVDPDGELLLNRLIQGRYRSTSEWKFQFEEDCEIELDLSGLFEEL